MDKCFVAKLSCSLTVLLFLLVLPVQASTNYVLALATGNNSGTDWSNAYTALPSTLVRGNVYYVGGGTYPNYTFNSLSGTSIIYIYHATTNNHGTATGWNNSYATNSIFTDGGSGYCWHILCNSLYFDGGYGFTMGSMTNGYGFHLINSSTTGGAIVIDRDYQVSSNTWLHCDVDSGTPATTDNNNFCSFDGFNQGGSYLPNNWLIQSNYIHGGLITVGLDADQNVTVDHCVVQYGGGVQHSEVFATRCTTHVVVSHCLIGNAIYVCTTYFEPSQLNSAYPPCKDLEIYDNVFFGGAQNEGTNNPSLIETPGTSSLLTNCWVVNNTILNIGANGYGDPGVDIGNVGTANGGPNGYSYGAGVTVANNIWVNCKYSPKVHNNLGLAVTTAMNNDGYILVTNNIFNNMAVSFANTNAIPDMHLTAQTPIGYVQVPNLPFANTDPDGVVHAASVGAYEYTGNGTSGATMLPPTGLQITNVTIF
jgi:hypothetical protein